MAPRSRAIRARPSPTSWAIARPSSSTTGEAGRDPDLHARPGAAVRRPPDGRDGLAAPRDRRRRSRPCGRRPATSRSGTTRSGRGSARGPGVGPRDPTSSSSPPAADVDASTQPPMGTPGRYVWAWIDEAAGIVRSRYFATDVGIVEDEATGRGRGADGRPARPAAHDPPGRRLGDRSCGRRTTARSRSAAGSSGSSCVDVARAVSAAAARRSAVRNDWDAIVVGLGAIGSGAAYWLSRRLGDRVLGLEQFELGHQRRVGQDHSRIIRLSYHRPDYVRLARRAYATWAEVEAESGTRIVTRTGGLDVAPARGAIPLSDYTSAMTAEGVPFEHLDARRDHAALAAVAARRRAPRALPGGCRHRRPEPRQRRPPAARPRARRDAPRAHPGDAAARRRRRDRGRAGRRHGPPRRHGRPRRRRLDERAARVASIGGCR